MAAIALCRLDRALMAERRFSRSTVEWSERVTDGEIASNDPGGLAPGAGYLMGAAANRCQCVTGLAADGEIVRAHDYLAEVVEILIDQDWDNTRRLKRMAEVCRDVFGNPFRPVSLSQEWRTEVAAGLAHHAYRSRRFSAMPILADVLQDAGCEDEQILEHCRGSGPHVRGCWVVDLVLGKE
ncbi:hypothetical protein R5W23_001239 [Gemmata sp. JC673]|uniref:SMI1/KNR4 family protein n=1 Tax=Gemmata algarum TaxID=2975278 RepID=A0ABU5ESG3_9BACT|nr:hypothetical protein [Gemmata algarum]MDY3558189.1 hypothetical protein [Gemmata algarum]